MKRLQRDTRERAEIEQLYIEYRERLLLFVKLTINNESVADDIVHDVFVEAIRQYESFQKHPNKQGWLYQTAKYKIMELNRRLIQTEIMDFEAEENSIEDREEGYSNSEFKHAISGVLTDEEMKRYYRYFIWGNSVEELAEKEGVTPNNMRVRLSRLRKKLIEEIGTFLLLCIFFRM